MLFGIKLLLVLLQVAIQLFTCVMFPFTSNHMCAHLEKGGFCIVVLEGYIYSMWPFVNFILGM